MSDKQQLFEFKVRRIRRKFKYENTKIDGPAAIGMFLGPVTKELDREHFYSIYIDARGNLIGYETIAIGSIAGVTIHPREVFLGAITAGAFAIIVAHNHPSGNLEPSKEDLALANRLHAAGQILGIEVLDSIIIGNGRVRSTADVIGNVHCDKEAGETTGGEMG